MKISPTYSVYNSFTKNKISQTTTNKTSEADIRANLPLLGYQDFNINFKARLNRTPENFYAQKFNQDNMPETVKKYLYEDFEERHHMPPAQFQREAFQYISIADTVEEVKEMYPDEPLFKDLRSFKETNARRGTLLLLRWDAKISNTPIFKDEKSYKDPALYLLKKVYLEGKTLEEINKDFSNDATEAILKELNIKSGNYFSYADLKSMGIKYPNISYYKSFLATRNDKEYIPATRAPFERTVSEETKEKLSIAQKDWWAKLGYSDRQKQIRRMLDGKELGESTYSKFQWQIMTIAASKIGFGEKLAQIFSDKLSNEEFLNDFPYFADRQRAVMKEFWNKDPGFKKEFSKAIHETISEFENTLSNTDNTDAIQELLNYAADLKTKVIENTKRKRQQKIEEKKRKEQEKITVQKQKHYEYTYTPPQPKEKQPEIDFTSIDSLKKEFKKQSRKQTKFFPTDIAKILTDFILSHKELSKQVLQGFVLIENGLLDNISGLSDEDKEFLKTTTESKFIEINNEFDYKNAVLVQAAEFAMNQTLYEITNDPEVFKNTRGDNVFYIIENNLQDKFLEKKNILDKRYKDYSSGLTENNTSKFFHDEFFDEMCRIYKKGFSYHNDINHEAAFKLLHTIFLSRQAGNKAESKFMFDSLKNYKGAAKFIADKNTDEYARNLVREHIVYDYICARARLMQKDLGI